MELGMVGLGRMGANMVRRLIRGRHNCVVYDMSRSGRHRASLDFRVGTLGWHRRPCHWHENVWGFRPFEGASKEIWV
jgi:6-phosphogluconate dehydrogenase (decarboxylating)